MTTAHRVAQARLVAVLSGLLLSFPAASADAQFTYENVHEFVRGPGVVMGSLVQAIDGNLYGAASEGGAYSGGTIFVIRRTSEGWEPAVTLHNFRATEGTRPLGGLIQGTAGVLYGTTSTGGSRGGGTVFRISIFGGFQVLASFDPIAHGRGSIAELVRGLDGSYYGTLEQGGRYGYGAVFKMSPTGALTILHAFSGADGASPRAALAFGLDGRLYGTTARGGTFDNGTIFRVSTSGAFALLHSSGFRLGSRLTAAQDGAFYGTTLFHSSRTGNVYSRVIKVTASGVEVVYEFFQQGSAENGLTRHPDGFLYGMTSGLGFYRVRPGTTGVEWIVGPNAPYQDVGTRVRGTLIVGDDRNLYGAAFEGGLGGDGAVWSVDTAGAFRTLHTFFSHGFYPTGSLLSDGGTLYGTTAAGGSGKHGTVFVRHQGNTFQTLAEFEPARFGLADLEPLVGDLALGSAGFLARTTSAILEVTRTGDLTATVRATDATSTPLYLQGDLYWGGRFHIFRLPFEGSQPVVLHAFPSGWNVPPAIVTSLIEGGDGALYGTTQQGGAFGHGTIFRIGRDGTGFTTLHDFSLEDGKSPTGALVRWYDDVIYGTTLLGGDLTASSEGLGTVFRITMNGEFTMLHAFGPDEGRFPYAGLSPVSDRLYGTTIAGGLGSGTVYSIGSDGTFTTVHSFAAGEGATPLGGITVGPDGLYGTTMVGGRANVGVIYRLRPTP